MKISRVTLGKIIANGVAVYVAGVMYEQGRKTAQRWDAKTIGQSFGNLFAHPASSTWSDADKADRLAEEEARHG